MEATLQFAPTDFWVPLLAAGILLAAVLQFLALRRRSSPKLAAVLTLLRAGALASVLFFVLEPSLLRERREEYRPTIAVAVDTSRSMGFRDGGDSTRLERARAFLRSDEFRSLSEKYYTELFLFSGETRPAGYGELEAAEADGLRTELEEAVEEIGGRGSESLGAMLFVTDGGHDESAVSDPAGTGGEGPPLLFLAVGGGESVRDIEVSSVRSAGLAFAGKETRFTVTAKERGFAGRSVPLLFEEAGRVLLSREITFPEEGEEVTVDIDWVPPRPGRYHLSFGIPPQAGEQVRENNRVALTVEAARDKIRVLLVSGRPSWNHRFLRDAFKGDPSIDLVSFIILRTATDAVNVPQDELSLIPFPTQKIFLEELPNFDLVVFENFSHRFYFPMQYLEKVREFIEGGGGFWMLGGPLSFAGGGYGSSPLEEALPLSLRGLQPAQGYTAEPFRPVLTPAAGKHPFFGAFAGEVPDDLPLFDGYNLSGPVRPRSVVLAEHDGGSAGARPIIVLGRYGQGRTMAVLTDFLWKWNFEMAGRGRGNLLYLTFVRQAVRWSVGDPQFQPVVIHVEDEHLTPGERLRASIRVLGEDFLPATEPDLRVVLREGGGKEVVLPVQAEGPGLFLVDAEVAAAGTFELEAQVRSSGTVYGSGSSAVEVSWPLVEFRKPGLNREALAGLSQGEKDAVVELGDHEGTSRLLGERLREAAPLYRVAFEEKKGLGSEWWAFVLILLFLTAEWALRKRHGMD